MAYQSVLLLLTPPVIGIATGYVFGGRLAAIAAVRLRALWLLWMAAAFQVSQDHFTLPRELLQGRARVPLLGLIFVLVAVWLTVNIRQAQPALRIACTVIMIGAALNAMVIVLNGRMPYSTRAADLVNLPVDNVTPKNEPAHDGTRLAFIGDVLPVPALQKIISPGDILIGAGIAGAIAIAMRRYPPPTSRNLSQAGTSLDIS